MKHAHQVAKELDAAATREGLARLERDRERLRYELKQAKSLVAWQARQLEAAADQTQALLAARFKFRKQRSRLPRNTWRRVVIPDTHGCRIDQAAWGAVVRDIAHLDPREVVLLGDHVDCDGFLAEHHVMGYVAQSEYSYEEDIIAAHMMLDQLQAAAPKAKIYYLEGNHEMRVERWAVTVAGRRRVDAAGLYRRNAPCHLLCLEKRGIPYYTQGKSYDNIRSPGTIKLGPCYFTHGISHGKQAVEVHLRRFGGCVAFGHTHTAAAKVTAVVNSGTIGAWCPGCLSELQPMYRHSAPTEWSHGYAVQIVHSGGDSFWHLQIPVIDGASLLADFVPA